MFTKVYSYGILGLDTYPVTIEVDVTHGLPATVIVGLPDNAVKESKERIRSAIKNNGFKFPPERITINLSPADIKKEGPAFDLSMALGLLAASEQIDAGLLKKFIILGELSLDGQIQPVTGTLPITLSVALNRFQGIILPEANAWEASLAERLPVYPARNLLEAIHIVSNSSSITPFKKIRVTFAGPKTDEIDFTDIKGQAYVKRGLVVAAGGGHNVLLIGPPGSGKTMLAKRLPTILPQMTNAESLETTKIHSVMGLTSPSQGLLTARPFRSPHHTASDVAMVGGGSLPRPGEVTLAHNGILFLDELPEFHRNVLEALRQPLEDHCVTVSRAAKTMRFPSQFMLVAAMNPCPCGWYSDPKKSCHCTPHQIQRYMSKISGPLMDRIDIHLEVPSLKSAELLSGAQPESSLQIKSRTEGARRIQENRFKNTSIFCNAHMSQRQIRKFCFLNDDGKKLLKTAIDELGLSARGYDKILKLARTIADLAGADEIQTDHLAEAIQYRGLDRNWWG